ncbi:MAG: hypothetical protein IKJ36_02385 [Clostridia bacterium]|nr:hypothetical protein [Clostridia bacterium]
MLIEAEMRELAKKKEYTKVFNYFHDEYTEMLKNFLQRNDVKVNEDDCLIDYIVKTRFFMPKYNTYTIPISNAMYNEQFSEEMKYELLMNTYKDVRKAFTKLD